MAEKVACKNCKWVTLAGDYDNPPYPPNVPRCTNPENKLDDMFNAYEGTSTENTILPLCQDCNKNGACEYYETI